MRHHQQLPEDPEQIPDREAAQILWLLGPLARLVYDQFARISIRSVETRRRNVLAAVNWPAGDSKEKLANLPILGEDLFDGQFGETVKHELERRELCQSRASPARTLVGVRDSHALTDAQIVEVAYWKRGSGNAAKSFRGGRPDRSPRRSPRGHRYGRLSRDERPRPRRDDQPPRSSFGARGPRGAHPTTATAYPAVGGRLQLFRNVWKEMDPVLGPGGDYEGIHHRVLSDSPRGGGGKDTPVPTDPGQRIALESELHALMTKRAIVEATEGRTTLPIVLLSNIKKGRVWRPILNLKPLNKGFVRPTHFRMETLAIVVPNLTRGMWASSVDLKDAYLHIPVETRFSKLPSVFIQRKNIQICGTTLRPIDSPRVFTRIAGAVVADLRRSGVTLYAYLDDWSSRGGRTKRHSST
ncbi:reverse transcriptase [Apostichopus japonicus]|uniref:Reverse transcriptase n=1 Tax=Stichopus japonicus TaxID=307972 RepID=A0A2G8KL76_STIJA|nr:reverse transcriptase [Apostichopus japonicus]